MARYEVTVKETWVLEVEATSPRHARTVAHKARQRGEGDLDTRYIDEVDRKGSGDLIGFHMPMDEEGDDEEARDGADTARNY